MSLAVEHVSTCYHMFQQSATRTEWEWCSCLQEGLNTFSCNFVRFAYCKLILSITGSPGNQSCQSSSIPRDPHTFSEGATGPDPGTYIYIIHIIHIVSLLTFSGSVCGSIGQYGLGCVGATRLVAACACCPGQRSVAFLVFFLSSAEAAKEASLPCVVGGSFSFLLFLGV